MTEVDWSALLRASEGLRLRPPCTDAEIRARHKAAPDVFEDPLATRSAADQQSLPARTRKRLLLRQDR